MGDENPIRTLGDYFKPSHEGYRNTIEPPVGKNVVPLCSDAIWLVQNGCSFHGLRSEDPNQHLKDFLKLVDSLDLDGSIITWEDLTTRFLAQFFPPGRTAKLRNDILMFQQHHEESLSEARVLFQGLTTKILSSWRRPLAPMNKVTTSCEICSGPHDTQYCMEDPEQAFVEYASSLTDEVGDKPAANWDGDRNTTTEEPEPTLKDEFQDLYLNLLILEVLAHSPIYNAILDKYVESLELVKNGSAFVQGEVPTKMEDLGLFTLPCRLGDSKPFDTLADLGSCVNIIPLDLFKKLNIKLLEETGHIFGLADATKSYPVGIVKDVEVRIEKLKLLNDFYVFDMKKDPETPLLVGRGFLATANVVIDCRMAKIAVGEGITRSVFDVKRVNIGEEEASY
ncbi:MAK10-like protein [Tanacetum coccineum]